MADPWSGQGRGSDTAAVATLETEVKQLRAELARAQRRIAELEAELAVHDVSSSPREVMSTGAIDEGKDKPQPSLVSNRATAWERAVASMRRSKEADPIVPAKDSTLSHRAAAPKNVQVVDDDPPKPVVVSPELNRPVCPVVPFVSAPEVEVPAAQPQASSVSFRSDLPRVQRSSGLSEAEPKRAGDCAVKESISEKPSAGTRTSGVRGPCFLDAIDGDGKLTIGQKATLRSVYLRFSPVPEGEREPGLVGGLSLEQALDADPRLSRGQREAVRTILLTYGSKKIGQS